MVSSMTKFTELNQPIKNLDDKHFIHLMEEDLAFLRENYKPISEDLLNNLEFTEKDVRCFKRVYKKPELYYRGQVITACMKLINSSSLFYK